MKLVHLADLHLGFRQFARLGPGGVNQRELDVAGTFSRTVDLIIAEQPSVIVIGGDVFHQSRPSNPAVVHAFAAFAKLRRALPETEIVMVAGNHDAPRTADAGCILQLFRNLRIRVVERSAETAEFPALDLEILAVPDVIGIERPPLLPSTTHAHRVLLLHGEIQGMMRVATPHEIGVHELHAEDWSYIALGHYHVMREVAPRAYYSGSLDYTSTNIWGEMDEEAERGIPGKGFLVHDLATHEHRFVPVGASRRFVALPSIRCADLGAAEIDEAIASAVRDAGELTDAVVRVVLRDMPRHRMRELDQAAIREIRGGVLQFQIDTRKPDEVAPTLAVATTERLTLPEVVTTALRARPIPPDMDREALVTTGLSYLTQTSADGDALAEAA